MMSSNDSRPEGTVRPMYDFIGKRFFFIPLSILLTLSTVYIWIERGDEKFGIDFVGGTSIIAKVSVPTDTEALRSAIGAQGLAGTTVQSFDTQALESEGQSFSIRVGFSRDLEARVVRERVEAALQSIAPNAFEILQVDSVGATISEEVRTKAMVAILIGLALITLYVTIRFEFAFALGALVSLFHDVTIAVGVYLWMGHHLNSAALAAALTIVGYSVNDTIVIFDRAREEIRKRKRFKLDELLNDTINICLSRTIITTVTTLFLVFSLLVFGGGALQDLALFLFVGMLAGVYSTIYIASPVVLWWNKIRPGKLLAAANVAGASS